MQGKSVPPPTSLRCNT
uniref:Uncharacterized protein n=1 Tax=Rhizophora mucronata TaxID=61149 RepID=A0A2P2Q3N3_RHIMU